MGNKSTPQTKETVQKTELPAWLTAASQGNYNYASGLPDVTPYTGEGVAGLNPNQLAAFKLAQERAGGSQEISMGSQPGWTNAMNFTAPQMSGASVGADAQGLFNPYTQTVVENTNAEIERQRQIQNMKLDADAAKAHAFGGDRSGVVIGASNRDFNTTKANTTANLNSAGWDTALKTALGIGTTNANSAIEGAKINLAGAGGMDALGKSISGQNTADFTNLFNAGQAQNQNEQQKQTFDYNEFLRQQQSPYDKLKAMQSAVTGAQYDKTMTGTETTQQISNPWMQAAGLGISALGAFSTGGTSLIPGLFSGLGGAGSQAPSVFMGGDSNPYMKNAAWGTV